MNTGRTRAPQRARRDADRALERAAERRLGAIAELRRHVAHAGALTFEPVANTIPSVLFELPPKELRAAAVSAFIAGDDPQARAVVSSLASDAGLVPIDAGTLEQASFLEALADVVRHQIIVQKSSPHSAISYRVLGSS